jgi:exosortase family protein XrtF
MPILPSKKWLNFIGIACLLYLSWIIIYDRYIQPHTFLDEFVIIKIIALAKSFLEFFGYKTFIADSDFGAVRVLGIDGSDGLWVGDNCNGVKLFGLFSIFILVFPSKIKHKLWFIPMGILLIHLINAIRVAALCIIVYKSPQLLNFNHTYTFTFIVYALIFLLWIWFINRFSKLKHLEK